MKPKILVVAYYFPPFQRVGGRRWAKFCKYLDKWGYDITVVAGDFEGESSWDKDIINFSERIIRVPLKKGNKPFYKQKLPENLLEKIKWKISYLLEKKKNKSYSRNYLDPSYKDTEDFEYAVLDQIEKGEFTHLIMAGGPFVYLDVLTKINKPKLVKILDLRDTWHTPNIGLTQTQIENEQKMEERVLDACTKIISTETSIINAYPNRRNITHIPHAIDLEDFEHLKNKKKNLKNVFVFGGDFYDAAQELEIMDYLAGKLKERDSSIAFHLHSTMYNAVEANYHFENITLLPSLKLEEFLDKIFNSLGNIYIRSESWKHFFSTKFYELVKMERPILYFGPEGDVSKFILNNKLGFHITHDNKEEMVEIIFKNIVSNSIPEQYDLSNHDFEFETKKLIKLLED